jgi:hypothetical protein
MVYMHAVIPLVPEPLRQLQELLCNPARNVGKDQIGHNVVGASQSRGELTEQALSHLGTAGQPGNQLIVLERPQFARRDSRGGC